MCPELKLFIAGEWRGARRDMAVVNPATEQELGRLPCADISDLDDALAAAEETPAGALHIARANSVPYGLAGYAFTNHADYIDRMIDQVEVGNLSINTLEASMPETPFGGVKSSGYGREGGSEGLDNYMTIKNVWHSSRII
jgi:acyl-CoA reductase-like NAD-dependent aldehyde dehydrogenase